MNECTVLTPFGTVVVTFGEDDDNSTYYNGDANVVWWLKEQLKQCTDGNGTSINPDTVDPDDLVGFCQSDKVVILPSLD
jgi:hypothetical protein